MNVIQEAREYGELQARGWSLLEIAARKRVSETRIRRRLVWLQLPREVQQLVATGKLSRNVRVARALAKLPREYQISEAQRLSQSRAKIEVIEQVVERLLDQLLVERAERYGRLSDGRPFLAVELAESAAHGSKERQLNTEALQAARRVCELCTLQPGVMICKPCPLVTMLVVLIRRK